MPSVNQIELTSIYIFVQDLKMGGLCLERIELSELSFGCPGTKYKNLQKVLLLLFFFFFLSKNYGLQTK